MNRYLNITADEENKAEKWWAACDSQFPLFAILQKLPGFNDGPAHAPTALVEVE